MRAETVNDEPETFSRLLPDTALLNALRNGDPQAAQEVFGRYCRRVRALARAKCGADLASRIDPEDIVQSVFRTFFQGARAGHYALAPGADLWTLLAALTLNAVRAEGKYHRAAKRDVAATRDSHGDLDRFQIVCDDQGLLDLRLFIGDLVSRLSDRQRRIVQLRLESYEVDDIAAATGASRRTVERVLGAFRQLMRRKLDEACA